jgi:DNA-binding transcriptional MerR regulator
VNPPAPRYSIRQLAELADTPVRTLRRWVHTGAIRPTEFRGPATSYSARHLDEARAVKRLLAENLTLVAIRRRLTPMSDDELARFVLPEPGAGVGGPAAAVLATTTGMLGTTPVDPEATCAVERWEHVTLLPGLQLLVRGDSGALVRRIAQEIQERYAVAKS